MSEAKHTKGQVIAAVSNFPHVGQCHSVGITGTKVAIAVTGKVDELDADISEANARRIAACWNACDGFSIEELECANLFQDSIDSANLINDLLATLKSIVSEWGYDGHGGELEDGESEVIDKVRAAIVKAEGGVV